MMASVKRIVKVFVHGWFWEPIRVAPQTDGLILATSACSRGSKGIPLYGYNALLENEQHLAVLDRAPLAMRICEAVPSLGAGIGFMVFIASMTNGVCSWAGRRRDSRIIRRRAATLYPLSAPIEMPRTR